MHQTVRVCHFSEQAISNLQKLLGAEIVNVSLQGGMVKVGERMTVEGYGVISISACRGSQKCKVRWVFAHLCPDEAWGMEFFEWTQDPPFRERYDPITSRVNYDFALGENFREFPLNLKVADLETQPATIQSIRIYHYVVHSCHDGEAETYFDFVVSVHMVLSNGHMLSIEEGDSVNTYCIYVDQPQVQERRLREIQEVPGPNEGQPCFRLYRLLQ